MPSFLIKKLNTRWQKLKAEIPTIQDPQADVTKEVEQLETEWLTDGTLRKRTENKHSFLAPSKNIYPIYLKNFLC